MIVRARDIYLKRFIGTILIKITSFTYDLIVLNEEIYLINKEIIKAITLADKFKLWLEAYECSGHMKIHIGAQALEDNFWNGKLN